MSNRLRKEEKIELLGRLPLFESCTRKELGEIATIVVEGDRAAGALLTREGQDGGLMFVIVDGTAEVVSGDVDDPRSRKVIQTLHPGDPVGELSLIDGHARSASVVATSPLHVLEIAADDFRKLVHRSPKFVKALLRSLSVRVREVEELTA